MTITAAQFSASLEAHQDSLQYLKGVAEASQAEIEALRAGSVMMALRQASFFEAVLSANDIIGWGANVGLIQGRTNVVQIRPPGVDDAAPAGNETLHVESVSETTHSAFAQSEDGATVIGTGAANAQKVWRSIDGGESWTEVTLPGTVNTVSEVLVFRDPFAGSWYVFRGAVTGWDVYRSTDNGASFTLRSSAALPYSAHAITVAVDSSGRLWVNTQSAASALQYSDDQGATWPSVGGGGYTIDANLKVNAVVNWGGLVYALGVYTVGNQARICVYDPDLEAWSALASRQVLPEVGTFEAFSRFATVVGPYLVTIVLETDAAQDDALLVVLKSPSDWVVIGRLAALGATVRRGAYQAASPGGLHAYVDSTSGRLLRAVVEVLGPSV